MILRFLLSMYKGGSRYSGLCAARSALSSAITIPGYNCISEHPMISRFLRGIFNQHPPMPKYAEIWDINIVLDYYANRMDNNELSMMQLTQKLSLLLMILGSQRRHTLTTIDQNNVVIETDKMILLPNQLQKQTKPGNSISPIVYCRYPYNGKLCVVQCMEEYIKRRSTLVDEHVAPLFITVGKPHRPATSNTIARWIKQELANAGIDTNIYKAHSCRSASSSKAKEKGIPISEILKRGGWTRDSTFRRFYDKDIIGKGKQKEFDFVTTIIDNDT